jgi:acetoin utilization deacetylase AcuC-like enzyme
MTLLFTHPACLRHDTGRGHPERPARLAAVLARLEGERFAGIDRREAPTASREQLARVHDVALLARIEAAVPQSGYAALDADTILSPDSGEAALRAAGAVVAAVDAVLGGQAKTAFCAVRPPGHHAEPGRAMGFCLANNVAIGAAHALAAHGLSRVAIVDFDVHHGNGTQAWAWDRPNVFFASTHQSPLYPGTGAADETGAAGNVLNIPLRPGSGGAAFRAAFAEQVLPFVEAAQPELLFISAGFDAHEDDPLGGLRLTAADYAWATRELARVAAAGPARGRIVSTLEGGYDLEALAESAAAHVEALLAADKA